MIQALLFDSWRVVEAHLLTFLRIMGINRLQFCLNPSTLMPSDRDALDILVWHVSEPEWARHTAVAEY